MSNINKSNMVKRSRISLFYMLGANGSAVDLVSGSQRNCIGIKNTQFYDFMFIKSRKFAHKVYRVLADGAIIIRKNE